jgi:TusE/DsrC/DsvC family sulfur relay protein
MQINCIAVRQAVILKGEALTMSGHGSTIEIEDSVNPLSLLERRCEMPILEYAEKKINVDDEGYLVNFDDWDESAARALAAREGINELADDRIAILKFIREYYKTYNFFPILNAVCKRVSEPKDCVQEKFMNALVAWKIAGLPRPGEPIISLLEAGQSPG